MIINSPIQRNIYAQTGSFSFLFSMVFDNHSGVCEFGFHGDNKVEFKAVSGRLIDHQNNYFSSYIKNRLVNISGNISPTSVDYYLNGAPIAFGIPRNSGSLNYVFVSPSGCQPNISISINGDKPSYDITDFITYQTGIPSIPVTITNHSDLPFRIFSGNFGGDTNKFSLTGLNDILVNNTYQFEFNQSGATTAGYNDLRFNLYTNFGIEQIQIGASGVLEKLPFYYIELNGPNIIDNTNSALYYCYFSNPSGNISILPSLSYVSGSGEFSSDISVTGIYSGVASGDVIEQTTLVIPTITEASGYGVTGQYITGLISGDVNILQYATGFQPLYFETIVSGIGTGVGYTGLSSGYLTGYTEQIIFPGSGKLNHSVFITGSPQTCFSINPTGSVGATGEIDYGAPENNDILFVGSVGIVKGFDYNNINELSARINSQGVVFSTVSGSKLLLSSIVKGEAANQIQFKLGLGNAGTMTLSPNNGFLEGGADLGVGTELTPSATFSGYTIEPLIGSGFYTTHSSGLFTGTINSPDYSKSFFDVWDLSTGLTPNSMVSFKENGYISGENYINSAYSSDDAYFYLRVTYNNEYPGNDIAQLNVTGLNINSGIQHQITGVN